MSEDQTALFCEVRIVLVVIGMPVRVDDDSYRLVRDLADDRHNFGIENREIVVDQQ
jgi:hypothetical protein